LSELILYYLQLINFTGS